MKLPIILDIGRSVDDFFAIALAACSPEIKLIGVTTAQDEEAQRARVARTVLGAFGRLDVPVAAGLGSQGERSFLALSTPELEKTMSPLAPAASGDAVEFMAGLLNRYSRIAFVVTGPLSNIAHLLRRYPDAIKRIDHIYFMGGWSTQALPEHNIQLDPDAAAEILKYDIPITAAGYEVTRGRHLLRQHLARLESSTHPGAHILNIIHRAGCKERSTAMPAMHDPLMIAFLCRPSLVQLNTVSVAVETTEGPSRGTMYQDNLKGKEIRIFTEVDSPGYFDFLVSRVAPQTIQGNEIVDPARWHVDLCAANRIDHFPGWSLEDRSRATHTITLVQKGACEVKVAEHSFQVESGAALYVPPRSKLVVKTMSGMVALWFNFQVVERVPEFKYQPLDIIPWPYRFAAGSESEYWSAIGERIIKHWMHPLPEGALLYKAALLELLASLCTRAHEQEAPRWSIAQKAAFQAKRWIESHLAEPIMLDEIANQVSLSKYYLLRVFNEVFGMPPIQYQRQLRIQQAKRLLGSQDLSVAYVASQVGYASVTAFTRAFKRETGLAPSDFRKSPSFWNS